MRWSHLRTLILGLLAIGFAVNAVSLAPFTPSVANAALIQPGLERAPSVSLAADLDQCRNGSATDPNDCLDFGGSTGWVNGNVGATQAHLAEGYAIPYRLRLTGLSAGSYTVDLAYDVLENDVHAIDYLMGYQWLDQPSHSTTFGHAPECVDPPDGVFAASNGSCDPGTPTSTLAIPKPTFPASPTAPGAQWDLIPAASKTMAAWGATITAIQYVSQGDLAAGGTQETRIRVRLTVADGASTAVLAWGGHIARQQEWGAGLSASAIRGSPYHMRLKGFCTGDIGSLATLCQDGGNQDRSLSAEAVYAPPVLTLVKTVDGGTALATAWTLTATGPVTISGATGSTAVTNAIVDPGTYALSESGGPAGYTQGSWSCVKNGGAAVTGSSIVLANEDHATCTVNNAYTAPANLTLVKVVTNDNGGTALASAWTLTATGPTTISGASGAAAVTNAAVSPGDYTLSESAGPSGYASGPWSCVKNGAAAVTGSSITLANGDTATCTITNDDTGAQLTVIKHVVGGKAVASDFTMTITGVTASGGNSFAGAESPGTTKTLTSVGSYGVEETSVDYYDAFYSADCFGTIALGQSKTCTVTNTYNAPLAHLTLVKTVDNSQGGSALPTAWTLTATGPTTISGASGSAGVTAAHVSPGSYALSESGGPGGYTAGAWSCQSNLRLTSASAMAIQNGSSLTLNDGDDVTCTINNTYVPYTPPTGSLVVTKYNDLNGNGARDAGEPALSGWTFVLSMNGVVMSTVTTDATGSATWAGLTPATYVVTEQTQAGWYATDPNTATPAKTVTVTASATTTVLFGNRTVQIPPTSQGGTLTVTKYLDSNANGLRDAGEPTLAGWAFVVSDMQGNVIATVTTDANGVAILQNLAPAMYRVTETMQAGYVSTDPGGSTPTKVALVESGQIMPVAFGNAEVKLPSTSTDGQTGIATLLLAIALSLAAFTTRRTRVRPE